MRSLVVPPALVLLAALATACLEPVPAEPQTGHFGSIPVEGLNYRTASRQAVTGKGGSFLYLPGETLTFSIGDFALGESVVSADQLSALDLFPDVVLPQTRRETLNLIEWVQDGRVPNGEAAQAQAELLNALVLLQSLDTDKRANNGIQIHSGAGARLASAPFALTSGTAELADDTPSRYWFYDAYDAGVIESARILHPLVALDHWLAARDESLPLFGATSVDSDFTLDGQPDRIELTEYDEAGYPSSYRLDLDADGVPESIDTYVFSDYGERIEKTTDSDGDGTPDLIEVNEYDIHGNSTAAYRYNADGNLLNGSTQLFDERGNKIQADYDNDGDGQTDLSVLQTFDDHGNVVVSTTDSDGDGQPNSSIALTYDENDDLILNEIDQDANGTVDRRIAYTRDEDGNYTRIDDDTDANGTIDATTYYTWDTRGNELTRDVDVDANGTIDAAATRSYDDDDRLIEETFDDGNDGNLDDIHTWSYDELGNLLERTWDSDGDGNLDQRSTFTYDDVGLIHYENEVDGDGLIDSQAFIEHDDDGNSTHLDIDATGDGAINYTVDQAWTHTSLFSSTLLF